MEEEKQRIKITIAERQYPLTIHPSEEESMRIAVSKIREMVEFYKSKFKDRDVQDALSMSVLHFAVKMVKLEQNKEFESLLEDLTVLDKQLDEYIAASR
ncbi:MAG: cell division protein ZapA [Bacteroidales bacterium]|nr:cell division protein ZapA [Bacteroidales bacterium]MBQ8645174.1 cell division protein ZapA [Bacteroidales bacterium]MBR1949582.1 cell division protein ZapA [Bacteroidales bacterium]MBR4088312.1 cell division protein ZapA [Bacteroidales bacterium]